MSSLKQIEANRRNAARSTGPTSEEGKQRSRSNAIRHGLTAETVIQVLEDAEDYKAFEFSVIADFDARTTVERELVLRLAGLLWRLRRATATETGLLQISSDDQSPKERDDDTRFGHAMRNGVACMRDLMPSLGTDHDPPTHVVEPQINTQLAERFLALHRSDGELFERLNRYESALWRQVGQLLVTLEFLRRYRPF
jgi:hypothetical protein